MEIGSKIYLIKDIFLVPINRAMILVHPFIDNFSDILAILSLSWLKTMESEKA